MPTLTKVFNFATGTEGWDPYPGSIAIQMAHSRPHRGHITNRLYQREDHPVIPIIAGSLRTTAKRGSEAFQSYWEWNGSYEDLGVPSEAYLVSINVSYLYRWSFRPLGSKRDAIFGEYTEHFSQAVFMGEETYSGPCQLYDSGGTLLGEFSGTFGCIDRTELDLWTGYPDGSRNPMSGSGMQTEYPIVEKPSAWGEAVGTPLVVEGSPDQALKIRIYNQMPETDIDPIKRTYVRFKNDRIQVDVEYGMPGSNNLSTMNAFF